MAITVTEYRGCRKLVYAEVTEDTAESYTTGEVKELAPVAEISKTVETSSESHYYDNKAAIVINSEGADTVSFTVAIPSDEVLADISGRTYNAEKKMYIESEKVDKYFAVGYVLGTTDGNEKYVWRYKGKFNEPEHTSATKDDGTSANNMTVEFAGIYTTHEFTNGKGTGKKGAAKAMFVNSADNVTTEDKFFETVSTPDTTFSA